MGDVISGKAPKARGGNGRFMPKAAAPAAVAEAVTAPARAVAEVVEPVQAATETVAKKIETET